MSEIKIKIGDREMSLEEARSLYDDLHQLFGANTVYIPSMWIYPSQPNYPAITYLDTSREGVSVQTKTTGLISVEHNNVV